MRKAEQVTWKRECYVSNTVFQQKHSPLSKLFSPASAFKESIRESVRRLRRSLRRAWLSQDKSSDKLEFPCAIMKLFLIAFIVVFLVPVVGLIPQPLAASVMPFSPAQRLSTSRSSGMGGRLRGPRT